MYTIKILDVEDLQSIRERWNELALCMRLPSVFSTWEWMSLWWKHFGEAYRPLVLLIYDRHELAGILPLAVRTMIIEDGVIPARTLSLWGSIELSPDHLDIVASNENAKPCIEAALSFLRNDYRQWDILYFSHLDGESHLLHEIKENLGLLDTDIHQVSVAPYIAIEEDHKSEIENYLKSLGKNRRHDIRRRTRILYDENSIQYISAGLSIDPGTIETLFDLHKLRAETKGIKTSFSGSELLNFHTEVAETFARRDWLRLRFLKHGDEAVAAIYCFSFAGRWFGYQSGLNPDWESKGAGSVLLFTGIQEAFSENMVEFDFLRGGEAYKNTWTNRYRDQFDVRSYNTTTIGALFKSSYRARSWAKRMIKKNG
jgi:hypothetical protein